VGTGTGAPPAARRQGFLLLDLARAFNKFRGDVVGPVDEDERRPSPEPRRRSRATNISSRCHLAWCVNNLNFERVSCRPSSWNGRWTVSKIVQRGGDTTDLERKLSTFLV